ncbi:MAG: SusC/RagA family TonB-linked outer membrane protein [Saprospiraceae bacterium]|nr:SusC/RagA family TonB-linked outer membrane protein [Saprospiraceae bacterium]
MKKSMYTWLLGLFLVMIGQSVWAQKVSGIVTSEEDGLPIPGVSVIVKGTSKATITTIDGTFEITANEGESIVFSLVGYRRQEFTVAKEVSNIKISMSNGISKLDEVVVTAMGVDKAKRTLGYSAQAVKGEELAEVNRENVVDALQGRIAGLTVNATGGAPGSSSQIILRAATSFSQDNQPLFVVDGVPINNRTFNQGALVSDRPNRDLDYVSPIADLNPNDIESVNVLKGPEASALYGFYGANGAIVITTKRGKSGPGKVTYSNNFGFSEVYRFPEIQTEYGQGTNGTASLQYRRHFGPKYPAGTQLYDNIGNFFQTGTNTNHNLSFEGGKDNTSFRVSAALTDNKGVIPTTGLQRYSLGTRGATKLLDGKIDLNGALNLVRTQNQKTPRGANGLFLNLLSWPAVDDVSNYLNSDGSRRRITSAGNDTEYDNPNFTILKNKTSDLIDRAYGNVGVTYSPVKWLNFALRGGYDFSTAEGNYFIHPESTITPTADRGIIENYVNNSRVLNGTGLLTATKEVGKLNMTLRLGSSLDEQKYNAVSVRGTQLVIPDLNSINNTYPTTMRNKQTYSTRRSVGFFAEATFDYNRFLTLTTSIRNDRTSTLLAPNNSFVYPGANVSFVFSELLKDIKWLDFGKLRFGLAGSGRDVPPYNIKSDLTPQLTTGAGYALGFTGNSPNLRPEIIKSYSVGTELNFFKNRLGLELTYFNQVNSDQIMRLVRLSYGTGYVLQNFNGGTSSAEGIEAQLNVVPVKTKDFEWSTLFNFYKGRTRIVEFPADIPEYYVSDTWLYGNVRASVFPNKASGDNYSMTTLAGYTYARNSKGQVLISPTTGLPLIDASFKKIGDRQPDFTLGIVNRFRYKSLNLSVTLDIRKGGDIYNGNALYLWILGLHPNQTDRETPRVVPGVLSDGKQETDNPTVNTIQVIPYYNNDYYRAQFAEESFIEKDINWFRIKDARLGWSIPQEWLKRTKAFKQVQIYVAGTDLFLLTNYSGADPNVNGVTPGVGGVGGTGFDYGTLSTPRVVSFGLTVGF